MVIREALEYGSKNLENNLYTNPLNESRQILSFLLEKDISFLYIYPDFQLNKEVEEKFVKIINKRRENYPLEYILNSADFYKRDFYVDERCLIPRWDTENLIEAVKEKSKNISNPKILEIGPGSGAISITLALELKNAFITGADISKDALKVCNINLNKYQIDNVEFIYSNLFENIKDKYDIIISNPPYIKSEEMNSLQEEVKKEPVLALDGGVDGLDFYKTISEESRDYLKKDGFLIFEIGHDQYDKVKEILINNKYIDINYKKDIQGFKRVIFGKKGE